jgi:hypothetical protein
MSVLLISGWCATPAGAQSAREYELKAVFLHNLATFVEWPSTAFASPDAPFVVGILGEDPFGAVLDDLLSREYVGKRPFLVQRFRRGDDLASCHLLFIAESELRKLPDILRGLKGKPVLTVGDRPGFIEAGGMVGLAMRDEQLDLFVNRNAVQAAGLVVSSKLLEVAQVVENLDLTP